tara:strand:+ start:7664 stop:7810 length:147 start_codon:yes stop_codon:yes gene_type:complete
MHKLVEVIRASNYRGYVPIETLPMIDLEDNYNAYKEVPKLFDALKEAL